MPPRRDPTCARLRAAWSRAQPRGSTSSIRRRSGRTAVSDGCTLPADTGSSTRRNPVAASSCLASRRSHLASESFTSRPKTGDGSRSTALRVGSHLHGATEPHSPDRRPLGPGAYGPRAGSARRSRSANATRSSPGANRSSPRLPLSDRPHEPRIAEPPHRAPGEQREIAAHVVEQRPPGSSHRLARLERAVRTPLREVLLR